MMRTTCKAINCFSNVAPRATLKAGTVEWWNGGMVEWWKMTPNPKAWNGGK